MDSIVHMSASVFIVMTLQQNFLQKGGKSLVVESTSPTSHPNIPGIPRIEGILNSLQRIRIKIQRSDDKAKKNPTSIVKYLHNVADSKTFASDGFKEDPVAILKTYLNAHLSAIAAGIKKGEAEASILKLGGNTQSKHKFPLKHPASFEGIFASLWSEDYEDSLSETIKSQENVIATEKNQATVEEPDIQNDTEVGSPKSDNEASTNMKSAANEMDIRAKPPSKKRAREDPNISSSDNKPSKTNQANIRKSERQATPPKRFGNKV